MERVFVGVFTATRFLAILTAGILNPAVGIFISLFIIFVGSLVLVFTQQISAAAVWAGVILQAVNTFNFTYLYYVRTYKGVKNGNFNLFSSLNWHIWGGPGGLKQPENGWSLLHIHILCYVPNFHTEQKRNQKRLFNTFHTFFLVFMYAIRLIHLGQKVEFWFPIYGR